MARHIYHTDPVERDVEYQNEVNAVERYSPVARVVWFILGIVNTLLGLRFLLRLLGANPAAAFTDFIYTATAPLVDPFVGVIRSTRIEAGIIDWYTLLAMAIYWLLAWAIVRLFAMARPMARY